jgi:Raf kinase inhibitor-like YbhB/YbcL family protein
MHLDTHAFEPGGSIPTPFTCDGRNISPALSWSTPPEGTRSFTLIMDDPDAPGRTWIHWVLYDLPGSERALPEAVEPEGTLASGARQGRNDFGRLGYGGPCPPSGPAHRYYFRLYALDTVLNLKAGAKRAQIDRAIHGHVLAQAELMGRYQRQT